MLGDSNSFIGNLVNTLKTGQLPNLEDTSLNPCKDFNCSVVLKNYDDFKDFLNAVDSNSLSEMAKHPDSFVNGLLSK